MRTRLPRILLLAAAALTVLATLLPLWQCTFRAPQYPDEPLRLSLQGGKIQGDLEELSHLNQFIGVRIPAEMPELRFVQPVLFGLAAVLAAAALVRRRWVHIVATTLFGLSLVGLLALGQWRLHHIGHHRAERTPVAGFKDFTPPVLGPAKIGNFHVLALPALGGWLLAVALGAATASSTLKHPEVTL